MFGNSSDTVHVPVDGAGAAVDAVVAVDAEGAEAAAAVSRLAVHSPAALPAAIVVPFSVSPSCVAISPPACQIVGRYMCSDSPVKHGFSFTPSSSTFVDFDSEAELERTYRVLADGGHVLMPLGNYGFSKRFGWLNDRFGVSWQLNLPAGQS